MRLSLTFGESCNVSARVGKFRDLLVQYVLHLIPDMFMPNVPRQEREIFPTVFVWFKVERRENWGPITPRSADLAVVGRYWPNLRETLDWQALSASTSIPVFSSEHVGVEILIGPDCDLPRKNSWLQFCQKSSPRFI